jgi:hypothetical protein
MNARKLATTVLLMFATAALPATAAHAAITHHFLRQITDVPATGPKGEAVPTPGPIGEPVSMTVDSGNLWAAEFDQGDSPQFRVDAFSASSGAFVSQLPNQRSLSYFHNNGIAVGHATGEAELYVGADNIDVKGSVAVFNTAGVLQNVWTGEDTPNGSFGVFDNGSPGSGGVAVDESTGGGDWAVGDVYVASPEEEVVDVFKPEAGGGEKYITQIKGVSASKPFRGPYGVTVDQANGEVFVTDILGNSVVDVFKPIGIGEYEFVRQISGTPSGHFSGVISDVAVGGGEGEGDIYVAEGGYTSEGVVDQFNAEGVFIGQLTGISPSEPFNALGVAVDPESQDLYVAARGAIDVFTGDLVIPDVTTASPTEARPMSATLNGMVDPDAAGEVSCRFEWGTTRSFGQVAPCEPEGVAEGSSPVPVHARLTGLRPDTTYFYLLQASNKNGLNPGEPAQIQEFTTPGPGVQSESVSEVTSSSATLEATIDPNGSPTSYFFQYSTGSLAECQANPTACANVAGEAIGAGGEPVVVTPRTVTGLEANTLYHYRVVAASEPLGVAEEFSGPEQWFTTQGAGAFALPDGRQWELVSSPAMHGGSVIPLNLSNRLKVGSERAAAGGGAVTYVTDLPNEGEVHGFSGLSVQTFSTRGAMGGWSSRELSVTRSSTEGLGLFGTHPEFTFFSEDLSSAVVESPVNGTSLYDVQSGVYTPLPGVGPVTGATPNLEREVGGGEGGLVEVSGGGSKPIAERVQGRTELGSGDQNNRNAVSSDGARVFFTEYERQALYMRDVSREETIAIGGPGATDYEDASVEGSRVFFSGEECEVRVNEGTGKLECPVVARDGKVLGISADGSWVYFVSGEVVGDGGARGAVAGGHNLYVSHGGVTKLVAVLASGDSPDWQGIPRPASVVQQRLSGMTSRVSPSGEWLAFMSQRSLTGYDNRDALSGAPDEEVYLYNGVSGRLVCASCNPSGARPHGAEYGESGAFALHEVVGGDGVWEGTTWLGGLIPGWTEVNTADFYQPHYLSNSGRLFFDANDALVPKDVNGQWDVYEYEPEGAAAGGHGCSPSSASGSVVYRPADAFEVEGHAGQEGAGCVGLITAGTSPEESAFLDASESGGDVFFITTSHLVPQAKEGGLALYDAHECTSFAPCPAETASPPECASVEGCRAAPEAQPAIYGAPSSATFNGAGNITSTTPSVVAEKVTKKTVKCKKGLVKNKKGRCVRRKKAKRAGNGGRAK